MRSVAFVCSANLCRSPMAHAIFAAEAKRRKLPVNVVSAGTVDFRGAMAVMEARLICDRYQTPMPKFISTCVTGVDLSNAMRVFVMEHNHTDSLIARGISPDRISLLGEFNPRTEAPRSRTQWGRMPSLLGDATIA